MTEKVTAGLNWDSIDFDKHFLPGLSVDTVIFGFHDNGLMVLLLRYKGTDAYALPGGFIYHDESGEDAAKRVLQERTGLSDIFLEQFQTFSDSGRSDPHFFKDIMAARGLKPADNHFLLRRFVSIGYYALVDYAKAVPTSDDTADECGWHDLNILPHLIQDHSRIIETALMTLREDLNKKLVGFNLLPDTFTISELQALYETVLEKKFLRTSFQRTMLSLGVLEMVSKKTGVAHKSPYLYRFVKD
ncbi:MAG: NUDIX hydrolase [Dyadobacter fermentans]